MDINPAVPETPEPQNTPSSAEPAMVSQENKKSTKISVLLIIGILFSFFVLPIPYYQAEQVFCKPGQTNCPQPGWHLNPSLFKSILASRSIVSSSVKIQPTPSPSPVSDIFQNWKVYSNDQIGIEFQYPSDSTLNISEHGGNFKTKSNNSISFNFSNDQSSTISDFLNKSDKKSLFDNGALHAKQVQSTNKTMINGLNAIQREEYLPDDDRTQLSTYFKKDSLVLSITIIAPPGSDRNDSLYHQVLATVRFTEKKSQVGVTPVKNSWTLYTDKDINFELQYPEGWSLRKTYGESVNNLGNYRVSGVDISTNLSIGSTVVVNIIDPKGTSFDDWIRRYSGETNPPASPNSTYRNFPSYRFERFRDGRPAEILTYYMPNEKYIVFFASNTSLADQETANQILSTFKFLN